MHDVPAGINPRIIEDRVELVEIGFTQRTQANVPADQRVAGRQAAGHTAKRIDDGRPAEPPG
jgi:hypothetical protein